MMERYMIIIFGATGDLAKNKLMPALCRLYDKGMVPEGTPIVGLGLERQIQERYIGSLQLKTKVPKIKESVVDEFIKLINYFHVDVSSKTYEGLFEFLGRVDSNYSCCGNKIYYLAMPPRLFMQTLDLIKASGLLTPEGWNRIIVEKPFGYDLESAKKINGYLTELFPEESIFRVDHYLGKELVQSILALRFSNALFEHIWNRDFIECVQITLAETAGIGMRAAYYNPVGAVRDMIQNHMLQILALTAMDAPRALDAKSILDQKAEVLRKLGKIRPDEIVVGQYDRGWDDGRELAAYIEEPGIHPDSNTETYAALKLYVNSKRFKGVPFYVRTGKRMKRKYSEVNLILKDIACRLFCKDEKTPPVNMITIRIQPHEGISLRFNTKAPGPEINLDQVTVNFCHKCEFGIESTEAYEHILNEVMLGRQSIFTRWDGIEASWNLIDPIVDEIHKRESMPKYPAGTMGPQEADDLLERSGHRWIEAGLIHEK